MVTISHLVKKELRDKPFLLHAMQKGIISNPGLADELQPAIEKELRKKIRSMAIVMALRRYADELASQHITQDSFAFEGELLLRTSIIDINVRRSPSLLAKLKKLYALVDYDKGDQLNIIYGNNEVSVIANERYAAKLLNELQGEHIIKKEKNLVALTIIFKGKQFFKTPNVIFTAVRQLAWEHINIFEIISTHTELTFILHKDEATKAYDAVQSLIK